MSARRAGPAAPAAPGDARAELARRASVGSGELWTHAAYALLALFALALIHLGLRPGGRVPIWIYREGRLWLGLAGLLVLLAGLLQSLRRPPFLRAGRLRAFAAATLVVGVANYPFPYPTPYEGKPSLVRFELPVEGEWTVLWGGEDPATNRYASFFHDRRYALALVRVEGGSRRRGASEQPSDWLAYDQPVLAPAAGRVVRVHDGEPDRVPADWSGGEPLGNHVVLEVGPGQYLFLCHLRQGSIAVAPGQEVLAGEVIGRVGSSGRSPVAPEPHLELHLQDRPEPHRGEAIPWRFRAYRADGSEVELGVPRGGLDAGGRATGQRVRRMREG